MRQFWTNKVQVSKRKGKAQQKAWGGVLGGRGETNWTGVEWTGLPGLSSIHVVKYLTTTTRLQWSTRLQFLGGNEQSNMEDRD